MPKAVSVANASTTIDVIEAATSVVEVSPGIFAPQNTTPVSYPDEAHAELARVEDSSFWFAHRNACLEAVMRRYPPSGPLLDVGGGRGFVTRALREGRFDAVLLEPSPSAVNIAHGRGLAPIVRSTLSDAGFREESLPAAGAFDVIEHIESDLDFVSSIVETLQREGRFYATVPAYPALWSYEDEYAGHYRRYTLNGFEALLRAAGLEVEFATHIFGFLVAPVFLLRSVAGRLLRHEPGARMAKDHNPSAAISLLDPLRSREIARIRDDRRSRLGTTILAVARKR